MKALRPGQVSESSRVKQKEKEQKEPLMDKEQQPPPSSPPPSPPTSPPPPPPPRPASASGEKPDAAIVAAAITSASTAAASAAIITSAAAAAAPLPPSPSPAAPPPTPPSSAGLQKNGQKGQKPPGRQARTSKALKSLQFANPGRQIIEFAPETSRREKRKLQTKQPKQSIADRQTMPTKSKVYDAQGLLICNGLDLCDCLTEDCPGCFYPCPRCTSRKCGVECRCDRKWLYEQIEVEGGETIRNKNVS